MKELESLSKTGWNVLPLTLDEYDSRSTNDIGNNIEDVISTLTNEIQWRRDYKIFYLTNEEIANSKKRLSSRPTFVDSCDGLRPE